MITAEQAAKNALGSTPQAVEHEMKLIEKEIDHCSKQGKTSVDYKLGKTLSEQTVNGIIYKVKDFGYQARLKRMPGFSGGIKTILIISW